MEKKTDRSERSAVPDPELEERALACPRCGGENSPPSGARLSACVWCGTALWLDRSGLVGHYWLPRLLDAGEAEAALRRWMAGNETVKGLERRARVEPLAKVAFPLWMFRVADGAERTVVVEPAAPTPIPQIADLALPAGRLESSRPADEGVEVVPASVPLATARAWLADRAPGRVEETALVEVPLWRARYQFEGRTFQALVEASTGEVLAAIYPEKAESPYILVAAVGLLVFGLLGLAIQNPLAKLLAYAVAALPLSLLAWWVTSRV